MKALIIEDEARAANRLSQLLGQSTTSIEVMAITESVADSIDFLHDNQVDIIFSDIQLGDGLSFEVFDQVEISCPIIFTTAYDQYAIDAFKTNGIDYLLKPIEEKSLIKAIKKMEKLSPSVSLQNIINLAQTAEKKQYKSRFVVKVGERIRSVHVEDILVIYSHDKLTFAYTKEHRNFVLDYSLDHIETLLDPTLFFRGSRKFMVALEGCEDITAWSNSRLKINIEGLDQHPELMVVARDRVSDFKQWLDR